jgi:uncharacterized membrane protein
MEGGMSHESIVPGTSAPRAKIAAPVYPSTPNEFITVLAHYHRAEIARMAGWRDRIDRTTNWAITVVGAMLSVSLSTPTAHHGVVLFAMLLVFLLLSIESRRYRFFDVYRGRVRRLERNYYGPLFCPTVEIKEDWAHALGEDLQHPSFVISRREAMSRRLRRNYGWMFLILLLAWLLKITSAKLQPDSGLAEFPLSSSEWLRNASVGPLPGWLIVVAVVLFYGWLLYATLRSRQAQGELAHGDVHV